MCVDYQTVGVSSRDQVVNEGRRRASGDAERKAQTQVHFSITSLERTDSGTIVQANLIQD